MNNQIQFAIDEQNKKWRLSRKENFRIMEQVTRFHLHQHGDNAIEINLSRYEDW